MTNVSSLTTLFNNTRTLKFKTQPTVSFFTAANITDVSGNNYALPNIIKRSCLWVAIDRFQSILSVSVFKTPMFVSIIMTDGSVKCESLAGVLSFVFWKGTQRRKMVLNLLGI